MGVRFRKARYTFEVAALTAVVITALLGMKVYMKRAFCGRYRELADQIGQQYDPKAVEGGVEDPAITSEDFATSVVVTRTITAEYVVTNESDDSQDTIVDSTTTQHLHFNEIISKP